jgi:monovalent cation/hydrogen antiporter
VGGDGDVVHEVRTLRRRAAAEALEMLRADTEDVPEAVREAVVLQYRGFVSSQDALVAARHGTQEPGDEGDEQAVAALLRRAAEAERELVIQARHRGEVSPEAADVVLDDIESRAVRDA